MKQARGFTLIEVMITVVIVAILAAIAIPSYQDYVLRGYRSEGAALLSDAAARQERYYAQNSSYVTKQDDVADLGMPRTSGTTVLSQSERYSLSVSGVANDGGYTLVATRRGAQARDTKCGDLTLDATGKRGIKNNAAGVDAADCWR